jgi:hypothetical protein
MNPTLYNNKPAPPGFGNPLPPTTPLPKGVKNKQVRFANQPIPTKAAPIMATPATGALLIQPGGKRKFKSKRRKNKSKKTQKNKKRYH